uniref:Chromosome 4 open reading frame 33 n=1 Tax=Leptobrachium leishanense TaxID=445787 RepID=A0A8C5PAM1_9ANUR
MEFTILHEWNSSPIKHDPVSICLKASHGGLQMDVCAPFFNDPPAPPGPAGEPFPGLWDYEVVEAFFLNGVTEQYLEVELCPHGQHLVLLLSQRRHIWKDCLPLSLQVSRTDTRWKGTVILPWDYFPPSVDKFNAYAIHGSQSGRTYEALYPVPENEVQAGQQPDFHRLEYFRPFNFSALMGEKWKQPLSSLWKI